MAHPKKRRQSMSPTRSQQPQDAPEHKKRKINGLISNEASSSKPASSSRPRVARSPVPPASDSSATLDGDAPPLKDKGKAVEKDPVMVELERLRKEVAHKNELLEKHERTVAAVTQTLTCQICLELMRIPYALAPCGHVSCHPCLVAWFTSSHNDHDGDEQNPEIEWYSDDELSVDEHDPIHGPGGDLAANGVNQENANAPNGNDNPIVVNGNAPNENPVQLPAAPAPAPAHVPFPNSVNRRKTCPHCRCVVRERPVQVYAIKDLVCIVDPPALEPKKAESSKKKDSKQKKAPEEKDPWKGIFRPPGRPGHGPGPDLWDPEDGDSDEDPPWPGLGLGLQNVHPAGFFQPDNGEEEEEVAHHPLGFFMNLNPPAFPLYHHHPNPPQQPHQPPPPPPPFVDEEDGVHRCGACLHEIWGGACTNPDCGVVYDDASAAGSDDAVIPPQYGGMRRSVDAEGVDGEDGVGWGFQDPEFEGLDGDVEDGYESSFIDDEEESRSRARWARVMDNVVSEDRSDSEVEAEDVDDFIPGPSRRWTGGRQETIVISSDEDEEVPGPSSRISRGSVRRIVDEDEEDEEEQEVEDDVVSVDEGVLSANHSILDGNESFSSAPASDSHSLSSRVSEARSVNPSISGWPNNVVDEEDGEDGWDGGEHVPYIWEEEDEDDEGEKDQDAIVYLHDEDGDDDDGSDAY